MPPLKHLELAVAHPAVVDVIGNGGRSELLVEVARCCVVRATVRVRADTIRSAVVRARHRTVAALVRPPHLRARSRSERRAGALDVRVLRVDGILERLGVRERHVGRLGTAEAVCVRVGGSRVVLVGKLCCLLAMHSADYEQNTLK